MVSSIFQAPRSGQNNVGEYMASGLPYVTTSVGSTTPFRIDFPFLTSEIYLHVSGTGAGASVRIGFTEVGVNGSNYFVVDESTGFMGPFRIRCKSLYVRLHSGAATYSVCAALTGIESSTFSTLTGSAGDPVTGMPKYITGSYVSEYGYRGIG